MDVPQGAIERYEYTLDVIEVEQGVSDVKPEKRVAAISHRVPERDGSPALHLDGLGLGDPAQDQSL